MWPVSGRESLNDALRLEAIWGTLPAVHGIGVTRRAVGLCFVAVLAAGCGQAPDETADQDIVVVAPEAPAVEATATSASTTTALPPATTKAPETTNPLGDAPLSAPKETTAPSPPSTTVVTTATTCPPEKSTVDGYARAIGCRGKSSFLLSYSERIEPELRECFVSAFDNVSEQEIAEAFAAQQIPPSALAILTERCAA